MKNLKRALSLALASVMVLGLMMVGAGAASFDDFSDKDKVVNAEAVSILNTLNVINGKDDGSFDPTGIVTRAEMAKMICVVLNGGKDPQLGTVTSTTYSDTASTWAAAYIEYCTNLKIVAGDGTGKFNPTNTVTGAEAAKMLLVALGYDSGIAGFTGGQWATSVNVAANGKGLYDGLNINPSEGLSRDNAAQMIYNALNADMVWYDYTLTTNDGSINSVTTLKNKTVTENVGGNSVTRNVTLLNDKFGAYRIEGVITANEDAKLYAADNTSKALDTGKTTILVSNTDEQGYFNDANGDTFNVASGMNELGRAAVLYVKPANAAKSNPDKATVIGGVILDVNNNKVVTSTNDDSLADVADDANMDLIYTGTDQTKVYVDYAGNGTGLTKAFADADGTIGQERILIDNDGDGDVNVVIYNNYEFAQVTKYSTKDDGSITLRNASGTITKDDKADVVGFDDVEKDDYVTYALIANKLHVKKCEEVTGDLTAYKTNSSLTVDGTKYTASDLIAKLYAGKDASDVDSDLTDANSFGNNSTLNKESTFYLDRHGYVVAVGAVAGSTDSYAFVWDIAKKNLSSDYEVKVTLSDGTTGTYDLTDKSGSIGATMTGSSATYTASAAYTYDATGNGGSTTSPAQKIYTYTINSSDEITLTEIASGKNPTATTSGAFKFDKGKASLTSGAKTNAYADNDTVFFYVTYKGTNLPANGIKSVDVYVGKGAAPSVNATTSHSFISYDANNMVKVAATYGTSTSANGAYLYLYGYQGTDNNGAYYRAIVDGVLMNDKDGNAFVYTDDTTVYADGVYGYTVTSDGLYQIKTGEPTNWVTGFVTSKIVGNSVIINMIDGAGAAVSGEYLLQSDTVIATIDGGDTSVGDSLSKGDYVTLVFDQSGSDLKITGAFILANDDNDDTSIFHVDNSVVKYDAPSKAHQVAQNTTVSALTGAITVSYSSNAQIVKVSTAATGTTAATYTAAGDSDLTSLTAAGTDTTVGALFIQVTADNGDIAYYPLAVVASI